MLNNFKKIIQEKKKIFQFSSIIILFSIVFWLFFTIHSSFFKADLVSPFSIDEDLNLWSWYDLFMWTYENVSSQKW